MRGGAGRGIGTCGPLTPLYLWYCEVGSSVPGGRVAAQPAREKAGDRQVSPAFSFASRKVDGPGKERALP